MILRVTKKIKHGSLSLPTVGYPMKAGAILTLKDSDYYSNDIQAAIRNGFLEIEEEPVHAEQQSYVKITNISGKRLSIDPNLLVPDEEMYLPLDESKTNNNLQSAARSGLIKIENVVESIKDIVKEIPPKKDAKKAVKKAIKKKTAKKKTTKKKAIKKKIAKKKGTKKQSMKEYVDSERAKLEKETETDIQAWDPHAQQLMKKDEASSRVIRTVGNKVQGTTENEEGVQTGKVDFSEQGKTKLRKKGEKRPVSKKKASKKTKGNKKSLKPVGIKRDEPQSVDFVDREQLFEKTIKANLPTPTDPENISFVDKEQTAERLSRAGLAPSNGEVE
jgi:hypothetical protein